MKIFQKTFFIKAKPEEVFQALTKPQLIKKWSGIKAEMDDKVGSMFRLWDGWAYGKNVRVEKNKFLIQEWNTLELEDPTEVSFILEESKGGTELELIQVGLPNKFYEQYAKGWENNYIKPIQRMFLK